MTIILLIQRRNCTFDILSHQNMTFLQVLLFVLLFYFLLKFIGRWLAPRLLQYAVKKTEERFREQYNTYSKAREEEVQVGEVSITKNTDQKKKGKDSVGEYIDYEEID